MKICNHEMPEEINCEDYVNHESLYRLFLKIRDKIYNELDNKRGTERILTPGLREALRLLIDVEYEDKEKT